MRQLASWRIWRLANAPKPAPTSLLAPAAPLGASPLLLHRREVDGLAVGQDLERPVVQVVHRLHGPAERQHVGGLGLECLPQLFSNS